MKTAKIDESFEDKKTFLFRHIFQWECKWAWTVKCSYMLPARLRPSVTSLILATTSYYSRLIEHEKFEITTSHPPFTAIFARKRRQQNAKKMNYESRNITPKMLIWICSILPCLVICDAFISQIKLGVTIDCCNLNCSIVNQSSCKLCSSTLTRISFNYSRMFLHYLFTD